MDRPLNPSWFLDPDYSIETIVLSPESGVEELFVSLENVTGCYELLWGLLIDACQYLIRTPHSKTQKLYWVLDYFWVFGPSVTWDPLYFTFERVTSCLHLEASWIRRKLRQGGVTHQKFSGLLAGLVLPKKYRYLYHIDSFSSGYLHG